jgi:hypothetical protein
MKIARLVLFAAGMALAGAGSVHAQYPYGWSNDGGAAGYYGTGMLYHPRLVPTPPYFALHPPVYYSCPVPRTYGYSPFAYPGYMETPAVDHRSFENGEAPAPESEELPAQETSKVAARGQWIVNPFITDAKNGIVANPFVPSKDDAPLAVNFQDGEF